MPALPKINPIFILLSLLVILLIAAYSRGMAYYPFSNLMMVRWVEQQFNNQDFGNEAFLADVDSFLNGESLAPKPSLAALGRIKLAQEDFSAASQIFEDSVQMTSTNPILLADTLIAFSKAQNFDHVITLYEALNNPSLPNQAAREAVALAYIHRLQSTGSLQEGQWEAVATLVPFDLYVTSLIMQREAAVSDISQLPQEQLIRFADFPIEAISPSDERLLNHTFQIVPLLIEGQHWDEARLLRMLRFWGWRYPDLPALPGLIQRLSAFLEEEEHDLLLSEINLRKDTSARPAESVTQNANLLQNPSFDTIDRGQLAGWTIADYVSGRDPYNPEAAFFAGVDEHIKVDGSRAFRIDGLWKSNDSGFFGAVATSDSAQGTYYIRIEPNQPYVISGQYRTSGDDEWASVYLGNPNETFAEIGLAGSGGQWLPFEQIACRTGQSTADMQLIVRLTTVGTVWFDGLAIRPVNDVNPAEVCS